MALVNTIAVKEELNMNVKSIDISENAIKACQLRGLKKAKVQDILTLENEKFDTILLLMNGAGMCGKLNKVGSFLMKLNRSALFFLH